MQDSKRRTICFVADDYGESLATNKAIEHACEAKVIRSVTIVGSPDAVYSEEFLKSTDIASGIHLYLTDYEPLTPIVKGALGENGAIRKQQILLARLCGRLSHKHLLLEFEAQLTRLRDAGIEPTFVDSHQNVHSLLLIRPAVMEFARRHGLSAAIRPAAQIAFDLRPTARTILSLLDRDVATFRTRPRTVVGCPGYHEQTIDMDEYLQKWKVFLQRVSRRSCSNLFVPCHPGLSPVEVELYTSERFCRLISNHELIMTKATGEVI